MALYAGSLYWPTTLISPPRYPELTEDIECDVLIIGGGVSGALCAYMLLPQNIRVVLVEKNRIAQGSTAANTGILQYSNDTMLCEFIRQIPREDAVAIYRLCLEGLEELERICAGLPIPADFARRESLYYASSEEDVKKLRGEYGRLTEYGFPVEYLDRHQVRERFSFEKPAALVTGCDAEVNPFSLVHSLVKHVSSKVRVYEGTEVKRIEREKEALVCFTPRARIKAGRAVHATGYAVENLPKLRKAELDITYSAVTRPVPASDLWPGRCMIWETRRPYLYIRTTPDNRIIIGGLDERTAEPNRGAGERGRRAEDLLGDLRKLFPRLRPELEYEWAATFGESLDGIPFIGADPDNPNVYYCLGYGGNGTVSSVMGAKIIRDLIVSGHHPQAHVFRLDR